MKPGRNDPCPCGSGEKYKHCCGRVAAAAVSAPQMLDPREIGALVAMIEEGRSSEAEHKTRALLRSDPNGGILWKILSVALTRQGKDALQRYAERQSCCRMTLKRTAISARLCTIEDSGTRHW